MKRIALVIAVILGFVHNLNAYEVEGYRYDDNMNKLDFRKETCDNVYDCIEVFEQFRALRRFGQNIWDYGFKECNRHEDTYFFYFFPREDILFQIAYKLKGNSKYCRDVTEIEIHIYEMDINFVQNVIITDPNEIKLFEKIITMD